MTSCTLGIEKNAGIVGGKFWLIFCEVIGVEAVNGLCASKAQFKGHLCMKCFSLLKIQAITKLS